MAATNCPRCTAFRKAGINLQCKPCQRETPSATTVAQRGVVERMRETGCSAAEAETHLGLRAGATIGG